jgi:hypothetical protein
MSRAGSFRIFWVLAVGYLGVSACRIAHADVFSQEEIDAQIRKLEIGLADKDKVFDVAALFRKLSAERRDLKTRGIAPQAIAHLRTALTSNNESRVVNACMILGQIGFLDDETTAALWHLQEINSDPHVKFMARQALFEVKRRSVLDVEVNAGVLKPKVEHAKQKVILDELRSSDAHISSNAARRFGQMARNRREEINGGVGIEPEVYLEIENDLASPEPHIRRAAMNAFGEIGIVRPHTRFLLQSRLHHGAEDYYGWEDATKALRTIAEKSGEEAPESPLPASKLIPLKTPPPRLNVSSSAEGLMEVAAACHTTSTAAHTVR